MSARRVGVLAVAVCGSALLFAGSAFGLSVSSFSPNSGLPNKDAGQACPGNTIMITGSGFVSDGSPVSVSFNGTQVPLGGLQIGSDSTLYAIVPDGATTGPITVTDAKGTVTAPGGVSLRQPVSAGVAFRRARKSELRGRRREHAEHPRQEGRGSSVGPGRHRRDDHRLLAPERHRRLLRRREGEVHDHVTRPRSRRRFRRAPSRGRSS